MGMSLSSSPPLVEIDVDELRMALSRLLLEYRAQHGTFRAVDPAPWVVKLFDLLGWSDGENVSLQEIKRIGRAHILRCALYGFPAFYLTISPSGDEEAWSSDVEDALTWLYNRGDEWTVVSDFEVLEIINVRWTDKIRHYLPFRRLSANEYLSSIGTLMMLAPERIHRRDLYLQGEAEQPRKVFGKAAPGERTTRPPITSAILDAILASRDRFLAMPPPGAVDAEEYDLKIHQLLMRLIFVRACEDMGLQIAKSLREVLSSKDIHVELDCVLEKYQKLYESELFVPLDLTQFDPGRLKEAIWSLYVYSDVIHFDFAAVEADILGMMYEEYLKFRAVRKLVEGENGSQEYVFQLERIATENIKQKRGIYYTPSFIVEAMVERAFDLLGTDTGWLKGAPLLAADLACGSGTFLASAFRRMGAGLESYQEAETVLRQSIVGIDIDERAVEATRLNLWLTLFRLYPEVHPLPFLSEVVFRRDSLLGVLVPPDENPDFFNSPNAESSKQGQGSHILPRRPDLILGNPPYLNVERQSKKYRGELLAQGYQTLERRADQANLFVERALNTVREGGIVALVVPNRIFNTRSAAALRRLVRGRAIIEQVIDFGSQQVFAATAYVCVVFLRKISNPPRGPVDVDVVVVEQITEPRGLQLREALFALQPPSHVKRLSVRLVGESEPVFFVSRKSSDLLNRLQTTGIHLGRIARVPQGIKVGQQGIYLVRMLREDDGEADVVWVRSFEKVDGQYLTGKVDRKSLRPAAHSETVQRYSVPRDDLSLIYPYEHGRLIPFERYEEFYPNTAKYLKAYKSRLSKRARTTDQEWHKLAEPRDTSWLEREKILVPQLAREGRMTWDSKGLFLVQGFGIIPTCDAGIRPLTLLGALNSALLVWATAMRSPRYMSNSFEYQGGILKSIPLPRSLFEDDSLSLLVETTTQRLIVAYNRPPEARSRAEITLLEAEMDALIYDAASLRTSEVRLVEDEVADFRPAMTLADADGALNLFAHGNQT